MKLQSNLAYLFSSLKDVSNMAMFITAICRNKMVHAFISVRLDYCNLYGLPKNQIDMVFFDMIMFQSLRSGLPFTAENAMQCWEQLKSC